MLLWGDQIFWSNMSQPHKMEVIFGLADTRFTLSNKLAKYRTRTKCDFRLEVVGITDLHTNNKVTPPNILLFDNDLCLVMGFITMKLALNRKLSVFRQTILIHHN